MPTKDDLQLRQIPVFADVPVKQLPALRRLLTTVHTTRESEVVRAGTRGQELLVLASGSAKVVRDDKVVATLRPGDVFGEQAMLTGKARNASVVVDAGAELLAANRAEFRSIVANFPQVAERLEALVASRN